MRILALLRFLLPACCLLMAHLPSQGQALSPRAEISLLTAAPGDELYSAFGHSAIRVHDPLQGIDEVYGYGTFNFDQPFFYLRFVRGYLNYRLDVEPFQRTPDRYGFVDVYQYLNRNVNEQVLNLSQSQKQAVYDFLQENNKPENRYYLYDYFFDNCATRPRDVFIQALGDSLVFHHDHLTDSLSFRDLIDRYLQHKPWIDMGIDLLLGMPIDRTMTPMEYMFHPDYLEKAFAHAQVGREEGMQDFVKTTRTPVPIKRSFAPAAWYERPWPYCWALALLVLGLTYRSHRRGSYLRWLDTLAFSLAGGVGWVLLLLMTATNHQAAAWNLNVLWLLPTHLVLPFVLHRTQAPAWLPAYLLVSAGLILLLLLAWPVLPQDLHPAFMPLMLILLLRLLHAWRRQAS